MKLVTYKQRYIGQPPLNMELPAMAPLSETLEGILNAIVFVKACD